MKNALLAATALVLAGAGAAFAAAPLVEAAKAGDTAAALNLLDERDVRQSVNEASVDGTTALIWAAHNGDAELVGRLLRAGAEPDAANDYGATALLEAATIGDAEVMALLLDAGADPNKANPEGMTPLMAVARTGNVEGARALVEAGADLNAREQWAEQTALIWAAAQGQPEMITYLIEAGADPDLRSTIRDWERRVTAEPRGKDLNDGGLTALLYAARQGCPDCARALVEGGADINKPDPNNITPLVMSLLNMNYDTASYLVSAGADPNRWDLWGRNPLYAAVDTITVPMGGRTDVPSDSETRGPQIVEQLLQAGANPNLQLKLFPPYRAVGADRGGDSALTIGATPLHRAARAGDLDSVRLLLEYGADPELDQISGITPVMLASGLGHGGADTRGRFYNERQAIETVRLLVEQGGADVNATDDQGRTALHGAAQKNWPQLIAVLGELGANPAAEDARGNTALDYAMGRTGLGRGGDVLPEAAEALEELMGVSGDAAEAGGEGQSEPS